jgi:protein tyrosine phosphatase
MLYSYITWLVTHKDDQEKAIVHCSAGIGRTGTTISLAQLILQIWHQKNAGVGQP